VNQVVRSHHSLSVERIYPVTPFDDGRRGCDTKPISLAPKGFRRMQHNGAVNSNAPDTAEDGCSLASREGLWQRNSVESTLVRAVRTHSSRTVIETSVHRSVEDRCGAQDSRNGHAPDKRERRSRLQMRFAARSLNDRTISRGASRALRAIRARSSYPVGDPARAKLRLSAASQARLMRFETS
jgi:hypothetical protein